MLANRERVMSAKASAAVTKPAADEFKIQEDDDIQDEVIPDDEDYKEDDFD